MVLSHAASFDEASIHRFYAAIYEVQRCFAMMNCSVWSSNKYGQPRTAFRRLHKAMRHPDMSSSSKLALFLNVVYKAIGYSIAQLTLLMLGLLWPESRRGSI